MYLSEKEVMKDFNRVFVDFFDQCNNFDFALFYTIKHFRDKGRKISVEKQTRKIYLDDVIVAQYFGEFENLKRLC